MSEQTEQELYSQFTQHQSQFFYFLLAIDVSAIAFAVTKTTDTGFTYMQIPLAFAVLFWCISFFAGMRFMQRKMTILNVDYQRWVVINGKNPEVGTRFDFQKAAVAGLDQALDVHQKKGQRYFNIFKGFLYAGILCFIIWHLLEMANRTHVC